MRSSPVMPARERPLGVFYTKQRFCLWWWEMHKDKKQEKETQILGTNNLERGKGRLILVQLLSCVLLFATPWTAAQLAPPSIGLSRQEWQEHPSGLPFPPHGYLHHPEMEPQSPSVPALASGFFTWAILGRPELVILLNINLTLIFFLLKTT